MSSDTAMVITRNTTIPPPTAPPTMTPRETAPTLLLLKVFSVVASVGVGVGMGIIGVPGMTEEIKGVGTRSWLDTVLENNASSLLGKNVTMVGGAGTDDASRGRVV